MNFEILLILFIAFMIPAGLFLATSVLRLRQERDKEQLRLDMVFTAHKHQARH